GAEGIRRALQRAARSRETRRAPTQREEVLAMQPTAQARVIAFGPKRRAARASGRRRAIARGIVSLWLGMAALALLLLVGQIVAVLLRHGVAGIGIGLVVVSAAG